MYMSSVAVYDIPELRSLPSSAYQEGTVSTVPSWTMSYEDAPRHLSLRISPVLPDSRCFHLTNGLVLYTVVMLDDGSANFNIKEASTFDSTYHSEIALGTQRGCIWLRSGPGPWT